MSIVDHIAGLRRQICPRTSYASSGRAASVLVMVSNSIDSTSCELVAQSLLKTKEFESVDYVTSLEQLISDPSGGVLIFYNYFLANSVEVSRLFLLEGKYKLVFFVDTHGTDKADMVSKRYFKSEDVNSISIQHSTFGSSELLVCYKHRSNGNVPSANASGNIAASVISFNKQPSVMSTKQFSYLWSRGCPFQMGYDSGKERVLQRLADKALHNTADQKLTTAQWDAIIKQALDNGLNDFDIYSLIRVKALGSTLAHDLQVIADGTTPIEHPGEKAQSPDGEDGGGGDGRAMHMVNMTTECIPSHLRGGTVSSGFSVRTALDYGCAEGAITAELGRKLGLPANRVFGADVRSIPSDGFTFVQLQAEDEAVVPSPGSILPSLRTGSVDLVTAAMVFHHVTHISSILLELRRVISPRGVLILREHHCTSPDGAAFLDIIHGLYSLAWSSPVEWPDFLREYKAFYRSREEWTALVTAAGFVHVPQPTELGTKHYKSAEKSFPRPNGWIPNVIKAYYGVYAPDPKFVLPPEMTQNTQSSTRLASLEREDSAADGEGARKRSRVEETQSSFAGGAQQQQQQELIESKKYPGRFYRINPQSGATEWV